MLSNRLINIKEVSQLTGLSKTTIYRMLKNETFPKSHKIDKYITRWNLRDIEEWIKNIQENQ